MCRSSLDLSRPGEIQGDLDHNEPIMPYFAMQYQVLFHDTMAYGSQHYMTNFKFQNVARETILFESRVDGTGGWQEQLRDILMLTREAYSLNLAPVGLGEKVGILLTYEEPSRSTVRLCFRVIDSRGEPVSCGYQTMILIHRDTHELVLAPPLLSQYLVAGSDRSLLESLTNPSLAERTRIGGKGIKEIFPPSICELGKNIANASRQKSYPRIVDEQLREYRF